MTENERSIWAFGYGSLIWDTGKVRPIERREGVLRDWHREWTWISSCRHGAPTCSLMPEGQVRGVFLRLDPTSVNRDLETFRKRERRTTEHTVVGPPVPGALIYFWSMGSNLESFPEFNGLSTVQLAKALAERAKRITEPGTDNVLPINYIRKVHEFDPDDAFTSEMVRNL
jgi:hypothetical protein